MLGRFLRTFVLSVAWIVISVGSSKPRPTKQLDSHLVLRVLYIKDCNRSDSYMHSHVPVIKLTRDGGHIVDVNFTLLRTIKNINQMKVSINRCRGDAVTSNTCEYFTTWSWKTGICNLLTMPNMIWTPAISTFRPPISCPGKEGFYMGTNASWDMNHPVIRSMIEGYAWTGTLTVNDQDDHTFFCTNGGMMGLRVPGRAPKL